MESLFCITAQIHLQTQCLFFITTATKANTEWNPIEAGGCLFKLYWKLYFQNEQSAVPSLLILKLIIYLPGQFEEAEETEHMVSNPFYWCSVKCSGHQVRAGFMCSHQNCAIKISSHTHQIYAHMQKRKRDCFWQDKAGFIYSASNWSKWYERHLSVPCQLHINAL